MSKDQKVQKNLNLSETAANVYLPALRILYGTYTTAVEIALKDLYEKHVAGAVGIQSQLDAISAQVYEELDGVARVNDISWRYEPHQTFSEVPAWAEVRIQTRAEVGAAYDALADKYTVILHERHTGEYYLVIPTAELAARVIAQEWA